MTYAETINQVKRERETETRVRAMDTADVVDLIHRMEDEATERDATIATLTRRVEELEEENGWRPIETAPEDGSWILICCDRDGAESFEVGHFEPMSWDSYEEVGDGLYRKVSEPLRNCSWRGINNFHRATHWRPLPTPPQGDDHG